MRPTKLLGDLITSATSAKAHFEVWWAQVSEAKPKLVGTMNEHSDFFIASADAHYTAFHVYFAHLFDKRPDSSSIANYLRLAEDAADRSDIKALREEYAELAERAKPLLTARHKTVAHVDALLTEKQVFALLNMTWNQARDVIYDSATFVAKLAGASENPGAVGIGSDRRLIEATLRLIRALARSGA